jgi:hypothetical protein
VRWESPPQGGGRYRSFSLGLPFGVKQTSIFVVCEDLKALNDVIQLKQKALVVFQAFNVLPKALMSPLWRI